MKKIKVIILLILVIFIGSCSNTPSQDEEPKICTREYRPVCAEVEIQCITTPCEPIEETFSNECMAGDNKILYEGVCIEE